MLSQEFEKAKADVAKGEALNHVRCRMLLGEIERLRLEIDTLEDVIRKLSGHQPAKITMPGNPPTK